MCNDERPHLLLNHIQHTSYVGTRTARIGAAWVYALIVGGCAGFLLGCGI